MNDLNNDLKTVVIRAQASDPEAFDLLVQRFQDMAVGYAYSLVGDFHTAQEVAQDAFVEAYRTLPQLHDPAAFPGWFRTLVRTHAHRRIRGISPPTVPLEAALEVPAAFSEPEAIMERQEERACVEAAVRALPEHERAVTALFYLGGYSHKEIGTFLDVPVSTVKNRLHSARKRLKERLIDMVEDHLNDQRPSKDERFALGVKLRQAVERGDEAQAGEILKQAPELAKAVIYDHDPHGETLLHRVASYGNDTPEHLAVARLLIDAGADVNAIGWGSNNPEAPPLMVAAWAGHADLVKLLLAHGADPNIELPSGKTWWHGDHMRPIETAAVHGHGEIVEALIEAGAEYSITHTVLAGLIDRTARLLDDDPTLLNRPDQGSYPVHRALEWTFFPEMFRLLLDRGADLTVRDSKGNTSLLTALQSGKGEAAQLLLERGAEVDAFAATDLGDVERLRTLLDGDPALANAAMADGVTPIFFAANAGSVEATQLLLDCGAEANRNVHRDWKGWGADTPLHVAAMQGHTEICRLLLEHNADPNAEPGSPALAWVARRGHLGIAMLLLDHGADLEARLVFGPNALDWAAWTGNAPLVKLLIDRGADVNVQTPASASNELEGRAALHFAA